MALCERFPPETHPLESRAVRVRGWGCLSACLSSRAGTGSRVGLLRTDHTLTTLPAIPVPMPGCAATPCRQSRVRGAPSPAQTRRFTPPARRTGEGRASRGGSRAGGSQVVSDERGRAYEDCLSQRSMSIMVADRTSCACGPPLCVALHDVPPLTFSLFGLREWSTPLRPGNVDRCK